MSNTPPPKKRARSFFIQELIGENELPPLTSSKTIPQHSKKPKDYVTKLDTEIEHATKFHYVKNKTSFTIEDIHHDPEGILAGIFQYCMDEAVEDSRERGIEATHLGCTISSNLLQSDIWIPIRQITEDTVNTILNRFNEVAQSKKQDGTTLWGEPFTVTVTTANRDKLTTKRQLTGGAQRNLAPIRHQINDRCLIKVLNYNFI